METISVSTRTSVQPSAQVKTATFSLPQVFGTTWEKLQYNYYSVMVFTIMVSTCIAGVAAAYILGNGAATWQLAACAILALINNTTAIAHMPVKWVVGTFLLSLTGNVVLIGMNAF